MAALGRRRRLVELIDSAAVVMAATLHEAWTVGAPGTQDPATDLAVWRSWRVKVESWIEEDD